MDELRQSGADVDPAKVRRLLFEIEDLHAKLDFLDKADGQYMAGDDGPNGGHVEPAEICIYVRFEDGKPKIGRLATTITHEWVHHWLQVHVDEFTSWAFDNGDIAKRVGL